MSLRLGILLMLLGGAATALAQPFAFDSDEPIEITADALEVVQADRIATFSGNVDAVQGDLVLSADELLVHYRGGEEGRAPAGSTGSIRRIEARGSVVVTSPRETAEGDVGVYDVAGALVTLEGSVVLTRDDNVIRGDRLELDLSTGVSRVVTTTAAGEAAPPDRRVRAVFVPGEDEGGSPPSEAAGDAAGDAPEARSREEAPTGGAGAPAGTRLPLPKAKPEGAGRE